MSQTAILAAILAEREARWNMRREFAAKHGQPVLSLTLNIPGADKNPAGSAEAFASLQQCLRHTIEQNCGHAGCMLAEKERTGVDGPCWIASVNLAPLALKTLCVAVEEEHPLGRLADADVLDAQGQPVNRAGIGHEARRCFLCEAPASLCRRQGKHSPEQIVDYARKLLKHARHEGHR
ncbi:MAG: citrate lyase holo-[acyl-carrier protein] synthase [Desulfovibrio sp.]|uniref:citrate lyase holo-[acyl-carrier protein] synthase n=1 Tax=Desulfovibrio sp. TaxID=885 RepID=UPI0039E5BCD1